MTTLIDALADAEATVTSTIHVFAHPLGLTYFERATTDEFSDTSGWTDEQMARARRGYRVLESYVQRLQESGVTLALGTDVPQPGRAALSEMLLLHRAGISMEDTLRIATLNSARAIGLEDTYGSVEPSKRAHLVLFDENPLEAPNALLSDKTVIKDGVPYAGRK
jgi:imidazolonepropionase-like amidohydrolase